MKIKKTLYTWLTNRYILIIRNEENFAEKKTFRFNYAKLIVFGITFLALVFCLSFYLLNTILYTFLHPEYKEMQTKMEMVRLSVQVDSLNKELKKKELFGENLMKILNQEEEDTVATVRGK